MAAIGNRVVSVCHNFGCEQEFQEDTNDGLTNPCVYHSGRPFFHDAYKGWTCCQQKSTDFTTFLNFKGCQTGKHSNQRPEAEAREEQPIEKKCESVAKRTPEPEVVFREGHYEEVSLKESKSVNGVMTATATTTAPSSGSESVRCKRCSSRDSSTECVFHCGQTIFHDSLKYWSCCPKKKFTDFEEFEAFVGCQRAPLHQMEARVVRPRLDWYQTGHTVHIVLYGLQGVREGRGSRVDTDGRTVRVHLCDSFGTCLFTEEWRLWDGVVAKESVVRVENTRVEMALGKRAKNKQWIELKMNEN